MLRIAVCDRTPTESDQLAETLRTCVGGSGALVADCYAGPCELKKAVRREPGKYRLILLDTEAGGEDGIAAARELREAGYLSDLVFVSESGARAQEAYTAYPTGYLTKPVAAPPLCSLLSFVAERHGRKPSIILNGTNGRKNGFPLDDIIYIEVFRTELEVHCTGGRATCTGSLREVCEKLPDKRFYRSHRSFIVNLGRVVSIEKYQFTMDNGDVVTVAKNRYAEAKRAWREFCE